MSIKVMRAMQHFSFLDYERMVRATGPRTLLMDIFKIYKWIYLNNWNYFKKISF